MDGDGKKIVTLENLRMLNQYFNILAQDQNGKMLGFYNKDHEIEDCYKDCPVFYVNIINNDTLFVKVDIGKTMIKAA